MSSTIITRDGAKAGRKPGMQQRGSARRRLPGGGLPSRFTLRARAVDEMASEALRPFTLTILRMLLGVLFLWFGGLKVAGVSPVEGMVSGTLPWLNPSVAVIGLGGVEVLLGLGLVSGVLLRAVLPIVVAHLAGTFLAFVMLPGLMLRDNNALLLTETGEFVVKNLVLLSATLVLMTHGKGSQDVGNGALAEEASRVLTQRSVFVGPSPFFRASAASASSLSAARESEEE
jgi:putative oxidoreductase